MRKMTIERAIKIINKNNMLDGSDFSEALEIVLDTIESLQAENEQLRAQVAKMREALIDYKTFLESFQCTCEPSNETYPGVCCERCCRLNQAKQAISEIDKALEVE